ERTRACLTHRWAVCFETCDTRRAASRGRPAWRRHNPDARARHRRQHRDLLRRRCGLPAAARLSTVGRARHISMPVPGALDQFWVSPTELFELGQRTRSFSSIGAYSIGQMNLAAADRPRRVQVAMASADLFTALGVAPMQGRAFDQPERRAGYKTPQQIVAAERAV